MVLEDLNPFLQLLDNGRSPKAVNSMKLISNR